MSEILLTPDEITFSALGGSLRHAYSLATERKDRHGGIHDAWTNDVEGVAAEFAVAKLLNRYYVPALGVQRSGGDVGEFQVRSTQRGDGCLLLHPNDHDDQVFILVVGTAPHLRVVGWIRARNGKREEFWREDIPRPAFFVPQSELASVPDMRATR